jgi:hypothetical protein
MRSFGNVAPKVPRQKPKLQDSPRRTRPFRQRPLAMDFGIQVYATGPPPPPIPLPATREELLAPVCPLTPFLSSTPMPLQKKLWSRCVTYATMLTLMPPCSYCLVVDMHTDSPWKEQSLALHLICTFVLRSFTGSGFLACTLWKCDA